MALVPSVRALGSALVVLASALMGACGGGGGGETTATFIPTSDLTLVSDASPRAAGLNVGDTAGNLSTRAGLRFGIFLGIPSGAVITSAKLVLQQQSVAGNPYGLLGTMVVDRVDFGGNLTASDFGAPVLTPNLGTLSSSATLGAKEVDVTAAVAADVAAGDLTSDFVVRFTTATSANATADVARCEDAENTFGTGVLPTLVVTYR
jgi:hypothetical protein